VKKMIINFFLISLVFTSIPLNLSFGQAKNLSVNPEVTVKIRAFDREFFNAFDVYSAGVEEAPTALLFDPKDDYHLPCRFWESPLSEEEIIYAIRRLEDQYIDRTWGLAFEPRALNIVNYKGEVLGYIYTSMSVILMDRKKDGQVTVFLPMLQQLDGDGDERETGGKP